MGSSFETGQDQRAAVSEVSKSSSKCSKPNEVDRASLRSPPRNNFYVENLKTGISIPKTPRKSSKVIRENTISSSAKRKLAFTTARQQLQLSEIPNSLLCRESEFSDILSFVSTKLNKGSEGGCIYISGAPGTGKTATVLEVMRYLKDKKNCVQDLNFCTVNAMTLSSAEEVYVKLWLQLAGEKKTPQRAMNLLASKFKTADPSRLTTILLLGKPSKKKKSWPKAPLTLPPTP